MRPLTFVQNVFSWEGIQLNMPKWCQTHVSSIVTELQVHACIRQLSQMCDFSDIKKNKTDIWLHLLFWWMRTMRSSTGTLCHSCTIPQENHMLYMAEQPSLTSIAHHCPGADSLLRIYRPETSDRHGAVQPRSLGQGSARWGISSRWCEWLQDHGDREIPRSVLSWIVSV